MISSESSAGASVLLKTSPEGTGIIAGGPSRAVLELAGYKNIRFQSTGLQQQTERCSGLRSKV